MKFRLKTVEINSDGTERELEWESYDKPEVENPEAWAVETLKTFNKTLRPNEKARRLLRIEILDSRSEAEINTDIHAAVEASGHDWEKTNLVTIKDRRGFYDAYQCKKCTITARRIGVMWPPVRDPKYRAAVYSNCAAARHQLEKLAQRKS